MRLAERIRRRAARRKGVVDFKLKPRSKLTLGDYERACDLLGLDPEKLLENPKLMRTAVAPPVSRGQEFLDLVYANGSSIDLKRDCTIEGYEALLGVAAENFIRLSAESLTGLGGKYQALIAAEAFSQLKDQEVKSSASLFQRLVRPTSKSTAKA